MSTGSETDHLVWIAQIGPALKIITLQPGGVDEHLFGRGTAGERRDLLVILRFTWRRLSSYRTGQGFTSQMSAAYSAIVRSLENLPELATFRIALRAHS